LRSWKATNEATYLPGGRGTNSSLGTFQSMALVSEGSCLASTRWRNIERDTLEHDQFDMATASIRARLQRKRWRRCGREECGKWAAGAEKKGKGVKVPNPWLAHGYQPQMSCPPRWGNAHPRVRAPT
jgi:hypothetical protein